MQESAKKTKVRSGRDEWPKGDVTIEVPEAIVAVTAGQKVTFRVRPQPPRGKLEYQYQWQKDGKDIEGRGADTLVLRDVRLRAAGHYRCVLDRNDEPVEMDYSAEVYLAVATAGPPACITGPFQPGPYSGRRCGPANHNGYVRFKNGTNYYWTPPGGAGIGTVTDISNLSTSYDPWIEVVESGTLVCRPFHGLGPHNFQVNPPRKYQFIVYVMNQPPPPSTGQTITLQIQWP
jgi:hypothetical protein